LDNIWGDHPESKPSFIAYDDACDLLRHIVTQDPTSGWFESTKFIVDAWHYIEHRARDVLCRLWCNPAPTNGSQPDLVLTELADDGTSHPTCAINTEMAEQLNSWLDGFKAQLSQLTDVNFDIFMHVLFLLFAELTERKFAKKSYLTTSERREIDGTSTKKNRCNTLGSQRMRGFPINECFRHG